MALPVYSTTWEADQAMQSAFNTYWTALTVRSSLTWDNVPLDTIKDPVPLISDDPLVSGEGFGVVQIQHADGRIASLGTQHFRAIGIMSVALYVENGRGRRRTSAILADNALRFFQVTNVEGVTFASPRKNEVGSDGRWWLTNILADFQYDVIRS